MEYSQEPPLIFTPLTDQEYSVFYDLEMGSFTEDAPFYRSFITREDSVLELGCGSGRLTRLLAPFSRKITALDTNRAMIDLARIKADNTISFLLLDMTDFLLPEHFDNIIIPYNTLNLLGTRARAEKCLRLCRRHLHPEGRLLLHLYTPLNIILDSTDKKIFQFFIMERPDGGKLIKETIKCHSSATETLTLEERYRDRPAQPGQPKRDLNHTFKLYAPPPARWQELIEESGFTIKGLWGNYAFVPFAALSDTSLLVMATPSSAVDHSQDR